MNKPSELTGFPERVVHIDGPKGSIPGILHSPDPGTTGGVCVIMFNSGMQSRVGPGRLYVTAARRMTRAGMHVIRVDLAGAGDSICDNPDKHFDAHDPDEAEAVIRYVKDEVQPDSVVLSGLCAGARVAMKASRNPDVNGVLAWSVPIYSATPDMPQSPYEPKDRVSATVAKSDASRLIGFVSRLDFARPAWWRQHFPGGKGLAAEAKRVTRSVSRLVFRTDPKKHESPFLEATQSYLDEGRKILFVYGDLDLLSYREFQDRFPELVEDPVGAQGHALIQGGTHTFSNHGPQLAAIEASINWLARHFGDGATTG